MTHNTSIRSYNYNLDTVIQAPGTYAGNGPFKFVDVTDQANFVSHTVMFSNDSISDIWFSFDGVNDAGRIRASETLPMDFRRERQVWFRGTVGAAYRFWAW